MGLELAPLWKRLLSGQRARSLTLLFMIFYCSNYDRDDQDIVNHDPSDFNILEFNSTLPYLFLLQPFVITD